MYEHGIEPAHRQQDAAQALVYTLEEWVVPNPAGESPHGFAFMELKDLHAWVKLLVKALPQTEGGFNLHPQLMKLGEELGTRLHQIEALDGHAALCADEWLRLVHPVRQAYDEARRAGTLPSTCRSETCRVWSLLHTLTIARLARAGNGTDTLSNEIIFDTITAFLRRYFTCRYCLKHFLKHTGLKSYGLEAARAGGPQDLAVWWWRYHSAVSQRVLPGKCQVDRRWPPEDLCGTCWQNVTSAMVPEVEERLADRTAIAQELIRRYWPQHAG